MSGTRSDGAGRDSRACSSGSRVREAVPLAPSGAEVRGGGSAGGRGRERLGAVRTPRPPPSTASGWTRRDRSRDATDRAARWASRSGAIRCWWRSRRIATCGSPPLGCWTVRALDAADPTADWTVSMRSGGVATSSLDPQIRAVDQAVGSRPAWPRAAASKRRSQPPPSWDWACAPWAGWTSTRLAARLVARDRTVVTLGGWPDASVRTAPIPGSRW